MRPHCLLPATSPQKQPTNIRLDINNLAFGNPVALSHTAISERRSNSHDTHQFTESDSAQRYSHASYLDALHQLDHLALSPAGHFLCAAARRLLANSLRALELLKVNCQWQRICKHRKKKAPG
jgi:hypothetical protein